MNKIALLSSILSIAALGCVAEDDPSESGVPSSAGPVATAFVKGAGIVVGVGASFASTGNEIADDATEEEAKDDIEDGVGGEGGDQNAAPNSPDLPPLLSSLALENPECVTLSWVGLTATINYNQCINTDGSTVNGAISLTLTLIPLGIEVGFDQLQVANVTYDGTIGLSFSGPQGNRSIVLDADFNYNDGGQNSLDLSNMSIAVNQTEAGGTLVINGSGAVTSPEVNASVNAGAITWDGECSPTSGSLAYTSGSTAATITFLATTPVDGVVQVTVGGFTTEAQLLPPCP